ncbi:MAG: Crp/Fnr family transcriptional regulator [Bacteroidia bacterium]|nr:Crp/Fnr family transcriptional regulator [Bacteroidia bacterium]
MDNIKQLLGQIDESILQDVLKSFKPWSSKKQVLINKGSFADKLFFINRGFAILKFSVDSKEWVRHIAQSGEFITSVESFVNNVISEETIFAIGDFNIYYIHRDDLNTLRNKYQEIDKIYTSFITKALIDCQHRIMDLLCLNAEEYYEKLLKEKNTIMVSIPQYELASYLGIKPQSLSRIRSLSRSVS